MVHLLAQIGGALVGLTIAYLVVTIVLSRFRRPLRSDAQGPLQYVLLVPALNEERVIARTLDSLTKLPRDRTTVVVIDDGSTDATAEIVRSFKDEHPKVLLLQRHLPDAQQGKGAALNEAFAQIQRTAADLGWDTARVVVGVVDADGTLPANTYDVIDRYFRDSRTGAVQMLVRIRNRNKLIGRCQDYEFFLFASITQTARENLGSVGLGGNGQFVRLSALESVATDGPWTDCLTEDLDLGLRLAMAGWQNRFTSEVAVEQQGVDSLRRLLRQRTRWMQGHFQCHRHIPALVRSKLPTVTVLDLSYYLLAPCLVLLGPFVIALPLAVLAVEVIGNASAWFGDPVGFAYLSVLFGASFGPLYALCWLYQRRSGDISRLGTFGLAHLLALYNWVWYVALWRAVARIVLRRGGWAKTDRVKEDHEPPTQEVLAV
jgi:cellulose synthase/poly-beta-1,6-N-acetylglucosamine synthase-like glycosyltransferase